MFSKNWLTIGLVLSAFSAEAAVDLRPELSVVKHQGERNTCSAFASTALFEFLIRRETGRNLDLSANYSYWMGKHHGPDSAYTREAYASNDALAGYLTLRGTGMAAILEADWPYEPRNWSQSGDPRCTQTADGQPKLECFTGVPPANVRLLPYKMETVLIEREKISEFLLREKTPVVFNVMWYQNLVNAQGKFHRLPTAREALLCTRHNRGCQGHVILLVGFDPGTREFIFRNSWGPEWGENGYGRISEDHIVKHCEICHHLGNLDQYNAPELRDFVLKTSRGASGRLIN